MKCTINGIKESDAFVRRKHKPCYALVCYTFDKHNEFEIVKYMNGTMLGELIARRCYDRTDHDISARVLYRSSIYDVIWRERKMIEKELTIARLIRLMRMTEY